MLFDASSRETGPRGGRALTWLAARQLHGGPAVLASVVPVWSLLCLMERVLLVSHRIELVYRLSSSNGC